MRAFSVSGLVGSIFLLSACLGPSSSEGEGRAPTPEEQEVAEIAGIFLAALSEADTATLSGLLAPGAGIHSVREGEAGPTLRAVSREDFLEGLGAEDQHFLERMWDPTVKVQNGVAMVWTPYDFYRAGEFSHCGIDIFTLMKGAEGWQVTNISYNVMEDGCTPSPLGPPGRGGS